MKAGLKLRKGYKAYSRAWTEYKKLAPEEFQKYDIHTISGVQFGIGTMNVAISSLPSKILSLIAILGISGERDLGFELLNKAFDSTSYSCPYFR
jgi:hypothetical protein